MSAYTPGPWVIENRNGNTPGNDSDWGRDGCWGADNTLIFGHDGGWDDNYKGPNEENARLIAAAPDLLAALKAFLEMDWRIGPEKGEYAQGYDAYEKATGEKL